MLLALLATIDLAAQAPRPAPFVTADLEAVREAVVRYVVDRFEPPCRNDWDGSTYCLDLEGGQQPTPAFLDRFDDVAPGLRSGKACRDELGLMGYTTDPSIRIRSVTPVSTHEASVDVVAFCGHGTPTVVRKAGEWTVTGMPGGWVGCGPLPGDCVGTGVRAKGGPKP